MSRLNTLSPAALRAFFSPESEDTLIVLITIYDYDDVGSPPIRLADNFTQRLTSFSVNGVELNTEDDVLYGVNRQITVNGLVQSVDYLFLPINITLPSEDEQGNIPRVSLSITDVTRYLTPVIRSNITKPPSLLMELVLSSSPNTVEASFPGFFINSITYNADSVQCDISMIDYNREPFPCFTFTPKYFPGLF